MLFSLALGLTRPAPTRTRSDSDTPVYLLPGQLIHTVPDIPTLDWILDACGFEEDKERLGGFLRRMLRLDPRERATAKELLDDPWVNDLGLH